METATWRNGAASAGERRFGPVRMNPMDFTASFG
jgi:hypothetical protein